VITEFIRISIDKGTSDSFLKTFGSASEPYYAQDGCLSHRMYKVDDDDTLIIGVVEWQDKAAFETALASRTGQTFLAAVGPLMAGQPDMAFCHEV